MLVLMTLGGRINQSIDVLRISVRVRCFRPSLGPSIGSSDPLYVGALPCDFSFELKTAVIEIQFRKHEFDKMEVDYEEKTVYFCEKGRFFARYFDLIY